MEGYSTVKSTFLAAFVATVFGTAAAAQDLVCEVKDKAGGFIAPVIAFNMQAGSKQGLVYDGVIHSVHGKPIAARVTDRGNGVYRFKWRVSNVPARPSRATVGYWADVNTTANTVVISGTIKGFDNDIRGSGRCVEGKLQ